jgi:hypothetical protein
MRRLGLDGYYTIDVTKDEVLLTVFPPIGGKDIREEEVLSEIDARSLKGVDLDLVKRVVEEAEGVPVVVGRFGKGRGLLRVEVSEDGMKAYMKIITPKRPLDIEEVRWELIQNGVVFGIDNEAISTLLKKKSYNEAILVAKGIQKVDGDDAVIEYRFDKAMDVEEGEVLATKRPPTPGRPGKAVTGKIVMARDGKDIPFPAGKNTRVSKDGSKLIATTSGYVTSIGGKVSVEPVYKVKADVGPLKGDINFSGTVVIEGNVRGIGVKAAGDLVIGGLVDGASLEAGGNIRIRGGITGKGRVVANGDVSTEFVKDSTLLTKGNITVDKDVFSSKIEAGGKIAVRGLIVGGRVRAREEIAARAIGSYTETETILEVGASKELERIMLLSDQIEERKEEIERLDFEINDLLKLKERLGDLPPDELRRLSWNRKEKESLIKRVEEKRKRISSLQKRAVGLHAGKISVLDVVHPGVKIGIGVAALKVKSEYRYITFYAKGTKIEISPYESP